MDPAVVRAGQNELIDAGGRFFLLRYADFDRFALPCTGCGQLTTRRLESIDLDGIFLSGNVARRGREFCAGTLCGRARG